MARRQPESGAKTVTSPFIEHVNLTVSDPDRTAGILSAIFGWHERWRGPARDGGRTIHLGSDAAYVALYTGPDGEHTEIGRAHVRTPVTNAHLECSRLPEKKKRPKQKLKQHLHTK